MNVTIVIIRVLEASYTAGRLSGLWRKVGKEDYTPGMLLGFERILRSLLLLARGVATWMRMAKRRNKIFAFPRGRPEKVRIWGRGVKAHYR